MGASPFFVSHANLTNYLVAGIVGVALVVKLLKGQISLAEYPNVGWVVIALFCYALFSVLWSIDPDYSLVRWDLAWPYVVMVILLSPLLISNLHDLSGGLLATLALGTAIFILIFLTTQRQGRFITYATGYTQSQYDALGGGNPLAIASLAGYIILIGVLMNFRGITRFWQGVRWGVVLLGIVTSIQSGSRGQFFATLIAAVIFLPLSRRIRNLSGFIATAVGILLLTAVVAWAYSQFAIDERWNVHQMTSTFEASRIDMAATLLAYWFHSSPLQWIIGLGTSASFSPHVLGIYPHVVPVEVLAEEGLIGFALFCTILFMSVRSIVRIYRNVYTDPMQRGLAATVAAIFLLEFILCCKQGSLIGSPFLFALAIILGRMEKVVTRQQLLNPPDAASSYDSEMLQELSPQM